MSDVWYIRQAGEQLGPYHGAEVRQLVLRGELTLNDEISRDRQDWRTLSSEPAVVPLQLRHDAEVDALAQQRESQRHSQQANAVLRVSLVALLAVLGLVLWQQRPHAPAQECQAAPRPAVNWQQCNFAALVAPQANLQRVILTNGRLPGARLQGADLRDGDLRYTDLRAADLSYVDLQGARLKGADLRDADLTYARLSGADLSHADLRGARLGGANLDGVQLHGALWFDGQRCSGNTPASCGPARGL
jgi:uncharacterized protein YjbI with pentapeptide repeats